MSSEWPTVTLQEITSVLGDGLHGTPKYDDQGEYYFINGNNLSNGKIVITDKTKRASASEYEKHKKDLNDRTILISINGTLGNIALYNDEQVFLGKSACYFNVKPDVDRLYIRYVLENRDFQEHIYNLATGSTIKNVSLKLMREFSFRLPPLDLQKTISGILGALDDKIQVNHQISQTLEQMAQAIFKSWFVDFDPVKAKIAALEAGGSEEDALLAAMQAISGKGEVELTRLQTDQPEQYTELRATAELFPSAIQDSELGEIPEGWSVSQIGELVQRLKAGKKYSQKNVSDSGSVPVLDQGKSGIIGYHNDEPGVTASTGDPVIVFANHTCYLRMIMHDFNAIQNVLPFKGKSLNTFWLYFATLGKQEFIEYKGHWPDFVIKDIVVPDKSIAKRFGDIAKRLTVSQFRNNQQNETLSSIRDALLPKLLSGELPIPADQESSDPIELHAEVN